MADKLRRPKKEIEIFFEEIDRLKKFINTDLNNANIFELKMRHEYFITGFENFKKNQAIIENLDVELKEDSTVRGRAETAYFTLLSILDVQINHLECENKKRDLQTAVPNNEAKFTPKLPQINLPSFSGKTMEWPEFYEGFKALVHSNTGLSTQLKFQFLRNSITGDAADIIKSLEFNEQNYNQALTLLQERYDNEKHICEEHIRTLFALKSIDKPTSSKLLSLLDNFNAHLRALTTLGRPVATWDDLIVNLFVSKLDSDTISKWVDHAPPKRMATFEELSNFIKSQCYKLDLQPNIKATSKSTTSNKSNHNQHSRFNSLSATSSSRYYCLICKKHGHSIYRCSSFVKKSTSERRKLVEEMKLCFNCLKDDHFSTACTTIHSCHTCKKRHHTLLHPTQSQSSSSNDSNVSSISAVTASSSHQASTLQTVLTSSSNSYVLLATAVVSFNNKFGNPVLGRVLLDSGSQLNFATESFCSKLGIGRSKIQSNVFGIGNSSVSPRFSSSVTINSRSNNYTATIDVQILTKITQPQPAVSFNTKQWKIPSNIQLADPEFFNPQHIDVLLGAELFSELILDGQLQIGYDLPVLQNTVFGWVVWGKITNTQFVKQSQSSVTNHTCLTSFVDIEHQLERFWKLETQVEGSSSLSAEESQCEDHFVQNTTRDRTGRFIVRLPFSQHPSCLGKSSQMAQKRFHNLEKRFQRNPDLLKSYTAFIAEYIQLGHMRLVAPGHIPIDDHYYLPHHCIEKPTSSTTKLRVVFDGSAKSTSGISINQILMVGAVVQNDVFSILIRFRAHRFVFSTDITKMYRQIHVHPDDTKYQLILWRERPDDILQTYELTTVTYGTTAAPFLATRCLRELANQNQHSYPLGSTVLRDDAYVDDVLTGSNSIESLLSIKDQLVEILQSAGMQLRKWYSNSNDLLADVPLEDQESLLKLDSEEFIKTLGVYWQPLSDQFRIFTNLSQSPTITKRSIISDIARVFDPLGLASPVVTMGKLFMQQIWRLKIDWDAQLPDHLIKAWQEFKSDLPALRTIHFPRHLFYNESPHYIELHGFSDASEKAYGAVIYTRCELANQTFYTTLLCAKSRVAPLQKISLPRLELCAATLLAELMHKVVSIINFKASKVFHWSDSTITLHWIKRDSASWKTFVANRVSNIQQLSSPESWRHIDSKSNPADIISRGCNPSELARSILWLHGPPFLSNSAIDWPPNITGEEETEIPEQRKTICNIAHIQDEHYLFNQIDKRYHSSFRQMQRIVAYVWRFISNCRIKSYNQVTRQIGSLNSTEINSGLIILVKAVQSSCFQDEVKILRRGNSITKNPLKSLSAFLDEDGVLRISSCCSTSTFSSSEGAILACKWKIFSSKGVQTVQNLFQTNPKSSNQIMGSLPLKRVQQSPPFCTIGVDFCGPLYIHYKVRGRAPTKVYVCVIVCFAVRAIHLELVGDMSTLAFLGALKRFISTRGLCRDIYSDNGTNFVGANSHLHEIYQMFQSSQFNSIHNWCDDNLITWHFSPPGSPHFGGMFEAAVKSAKFHLRRVVGDAHLTYEELLTVIKQIEGVLNSRPITPLSSTPDDYEALTPGHFLVGRPLLTLPERDFSSERLSLLRRWELVTGIVQHFWSRWNKEYLTNLQIRSKWTTTSQNIKVDDMVIVKDDNVPPSKWLLARVLAVYPGADGFVRVATIRTKTGIYKRPITKLCPLPTAEEEKLDSSSCQGGENV